MVPAFILENSKPKEELQENATNAKCFTHQLLIVHYVCFLIFIRDFFLTSESHRHSSDFSPNASARHPKNNDTLFIKAQVSHYTPKFTIDVIITVTVFNLLKCPSNLLCDLKNKI